MTNGRVRDYPRTEDGRTSRLRHETGMTLPEVMIALTLVSALMALGLPAIDRGQTSEARDEFALAHELARSAAVQHGRVAELHIDPDAPAYWIQVDTTGAGAYDTLRMRGMPSGEVELASDRTVLCFDARGLATTRGACQEADATVVFTDSWGADTVTTTGAGMVLR